MKYCVPFLFAAAAVLLLSPDAASALDVCFLFEEAPQPPYDVGECSCSEDGKEFTCDFSRSVVAGTVCNTVGARFPENSICNCEAAVLTCSASIGGGTCGVLDSIEDILTAPMPQLMQNLFQNFCSCEEETNVWTCDFSALPGNVNACAAFPTGIPNCACADQLWTCDIDSLFQYVVLSGISRGSSGSSAPSAPGTDETPSTEAPPPPDAETEAPATDAPPPPDAETEAPATDAPPPPDAETVAPGIGDLTLPSAKTEGPATATPSDLATDAPTGGTDGDRDISAAAAAAANVVGILTTTTFTGVVFIATFLWL